MSDIGNGTAAQPGANPAAQPAQPSNFEQIDRNELAELRRARDQARGAQDFYQKAKAAGFDRPEAFESYAQQQARLKKHGVDVNRILSSYENEPGESGAPVVDPDEFAKSVREATLSEVDKRFDFREKKGSHGEQMSKIAAEVDKFADSVEDLTATEKRWLKADLAAEMDRARRSADNMYDPDHPLHTYDFKPLSSDKLAAILAERKKELATIKATRLEAKGVAAQKPSGSPAGQGGTQGKPTNQPNTRPDGRPTREAMLDRVGKRIEARQGGPVSSVAGG